MVSQRKDAGPKKPRRPPATTPDAREGQLIDLAVGLAEKQLREGTASSQVQTLYLKLGSSRERAEQERLKNENELLRKKIEGLESAQRTEELMKEALDAFRSYSPDAASNRTYDD